MPLDFNAYTNQGLIAVFYTQQFLLVEVIETRYQTLSKGTNILPRTEHLCDLSRLRDGCDNCFSAKPARGGETRFGYCP